MLVYGDHSEVVDPRERLSAIVHIIAAVDEMPPGLERHAKVTGALIAAGQLQQGVEDEGCSTPELSTLVHRLAQCVVRSSDSRFTQGGDLPDVPQMSLPGRAELRLPEGFAFYAVYPEAYAAAARKLKLTGPPRVIGIRSIGTTLGAIVAAALDAPEATTVRPFGDPFARKVELPAEIVDGHSHYVIVDEGPGLSGSSFGSVADWLARHDIPQERVAFLPSHSGGLGSEASDAHRRRWARSQRVAAEFDPSFLLEQFGRLEEFAIGSAWERRKFIATVGGKHVLLKFAGLGAIGERKLEMARLLHAGGFTPEPLGLVHGFLVERWHDDARSLSAGDQPLTEIGRYIGARARLLPAGEASGASMPELITMCRRNIELSLGAGSAGLVGRWDADNLSRRVHRIRTDNKLERREWVRLGDGRLLKTDALDHHQAHDLIGCQGVEWDIAGAIAEFELDDGSAAALIGAAGVPVDPELLQFYCLAYAAFRLGQCSLSSDQATAHRHVRSLQHLLHQGKAARESAGILV